MTQDEKTQGSAVEPEDMYRMGGKATEEQDAEGHKRFVRATEDPEAPASAADIKATEDTDTAGHKRFVRATEVPEAPAPEGTIK